MAEAGWNWRTWFALGVLWLGALWLGACGTVRAQTVLPAPASMQGIQIEALPSGSLAGRLTDLRSAPLAGVSVTLHNQATGVEVRAVTAKNGGFRFARLEAGEYTLEADEPQLGRGRLEGILVTGGMEARVQAAMQFEPAAPEFHPTPLVEATAPPGEIAVPPRTPATMPLMAYATPVVARPQAPGAATPDSTAVMPVAVHSQLAAPGRPQSAPVSRMPELRVPASCATRRARIPIPRFKILSPMRLSLRNSELAVRSMRRIHTTAARRTRASAASLATPPIRR
jgi:carboxypeptidase family protein